MACKSIIPYSIASMDQNRILNFNINYKVISSMFNNKIQDFNEKSCDKQNTTKLNKSWHVQFSKPKGSGVEKE